MLSVYERGMYRGSIYEELMNIIVTFLMLMSNVLDSK